MVVQPILKQRFPGLIVICFNQIRLKYIYLEDNNLALSKCKHFRITILNRVKINLFEIG